MIQRSKNPSKNLRIISKWDVSPNIALVKYWGKYHEELIIPLNTSVSITLNQEELKTLTLVKLSKNYKEDSLTINGCIFPLSSRVLNLIGSMRGKCQEIEDKKLKITVTKEELREMRLKIVSSNDFPTGAGLASSASGLACLALCLKDVYNFKESFPGEFISLTRKASGSACRSLFGGLVQWKGLDLIRNERTAHFKEETKCPESSPDSLSLENISKLSLALELTDFRNAINDFYVLIMITEEGPKKVPSTSGMKQSAETSELLKHRVERLAIQHYQDLLLSLKGQNFDRFAEIIMKDSNQFHAVCLDTLPPIFYLNRDSQKIIAFVHTLNGFLKPKIAYTFDAGPNPMLIIHREIIDQVLALSMAAFGVSSDKMNSFANFVHSQSPQTQKIEIPSSVSSLKDLLKDSVRYFLLTRPGNGPKKHA